MNGETDGPEMATAPRPNPELRTPDAGRKPLLVISYYTTSTPYAEEVRALSETVRACGMAIAVRGYPPTGSWSANCRRKAYVIGQMLAEFGPMHNLLWLDADARMRWRPEELEAMPPEVDIGVHYLGGTELLSNTIWLRHSPMACEFVRCWCRLNNEKPNNPFADQENMGDAIELVRPEGLVVQPLSGRYAWINDFTPVKHPECATPIIEQTQASRRLKGAVGGQ